MARNERPKQRARELAGQAAAEGWSPWALASRIAEETSVSLLQAHRLARGWTLADARIELGGIGVRVTTQQLSAWETGRGRPGDTHLDHLCRLYETRPDRLGFGTDYTPAGAETGAQPVRQADGDGAPKLPYTAPDNIPAALPSLAVIRARMTAALSPPLAEVTIEQWERRAAEHGQEYQVLPPTRLLHDSVCDFVELQQMLEQSQAADARARLCRVTAQLAGTAGIALVALGEHREARRWYQVAQLAADETGDRALRAWLLAREAVIPFYFGAPAAALALAERARLLAGATVCATAAWAPALEARALARLGRHREAQDAFKLAQGAFARLGATDTGDTAYGYTERQLVWHEGSMWTTIGDTRRAQRALHEARGLYGPEEHLDRALITMDEATSLIGVGEVSVACRETERLLLGLPSDHLTGIVVARARELLGVVPARAAITAPVRDLRALLDDGVPGMVALQ
ncbi:helix-turn-helix transcriptional regulator [Streptomyces sp. NPDC005892]|uniref:helix-turn-helix transcriptional regulator n=1 Tax=Streptomyces sp. NPDC005892 TaxID=3155593 RepID=UPI0034072287